MILGRSRRAVDRLFVAATILLVVAGAAGAGALFYYQTSLPSPGSNQTVTQPPSQVTSVASSYSVSSTSSPAAQTSTSLGSASASACLNNSSLLNNTSALAAFASEVVKLYTLNYTANDLFGNFSEMAFGSQTIINGSSLGGSSVDSYSVVGRPVVNSVEYYEVNFTSSAFGTTLNETAFFAPDGNATTITAGFPIGDLNGSSAATEGQSLVSPFLYQMQTSAYAKAIEASPTTGLKVLNETTVSLGPTSVKITYYAPTNLPLSSCGFTITKETLGLGTAPGTNIPLGLYIDDAVSQQGTTIETVVAVTSLAVANP